MSQKVYGNEDLPRRRAECIFSSKCHLEFGTGGYFRKAWSERSWLRSQAALSSPGGVRGAQTAVLQLKANPAKLASAGAAGR